MPRMNCPDCGRFMRLTNRMADEGEFDEELAFECGLTEERLADAMFDFEGEWSRFHFMYDMWECVCGQLIAHTEGRTYWWNPQTGCYDGQKPLTPKEQAALERARQEAAGQLPLI